MIHVFFIATLLSSNADEARAKAVLTLAAAAAQAKPAPDVTFFERLTVMPSEVREAEPVKAEPSCKCSPCHCDECACPGSLCSCAGCGLSLEEAAALATKRKLPLVVWVGEFTHESLGKRLPAAVHVRVTDWKGDRSPGVVACPLHGGWPHARAPIPAARADLATVLEELGGAWLQEVKARPAPKAYFAPPRTVPC